MLPRSTPRRRLQALAIAAGLLLLYALFGFLVLPAIVQGQLEQRLAALLGRSVSVGRVHLNPFTLSLTLEDFMIRESDGRTPFVAWSRLEVNFDAIGSLGGAWVMSDLELRSLRVNVQVKPGGALNFSDLLARLTPAPTTGAGAAPTTPARPLRIERLAVSEARVDFADLSRTQPFRTTLGPVTFAASGFQSRGARGAPYRFEAETESGEKIRWTGSLQADPLRSTGEFRLENIPLAKYEPYHGEHLRAEIAGGRLGLSGRYEISLEETSRALRLTDGAVQLRGLRVLERPGQDPIFELPLLDLTRISADALKPRLEIGSVTLVGGYLRARREADGRLNLVSITSSPEPSAPRPAAPPAAPAAAPEIAIGEITLRECAVDFVDLTSPRSARLGLTALQASVKGFTLAPGAELPVEFACNWAPRGTVRTAGTATLAPQPKASLKTVVSGLDLLPLGPYLEQFAAGRLTQGALSTTHTLQLEIAGDTPVAAFGGSVQVEKLGLVDSARNEDLAGVATLALDGIQASTAGTGQIAISEVKVAGPYARLVIGPDRKLNLTSLAKAPPAAAAPPAVAATPPRVEIGRVTISDGDFSLTDRSLSPNVRAVLGQFGGTIAGLSSENLTKAGVDLKGTLDGAGPVAISGRLDPLGAKRFVDLKLDARNVDLVAFNGYSGHYAGLELARGKLGASVHLLVDGPLIDAENKVTIDRLTFGAPVASPDATKLPVRLGVALLKDLDGRIVIDLPVKGRLDDPEFRVGRVVGRVLVNLLTKAATSPFTLLGSMFGGGGEELAYQEFAPGSSQLTAAQLPKLDTMIKALSNRPELSLALEGSYDVAADTHALKRIKLADRVRRAVWEQRRHADAGTPPPEQIVVTPAEEAAMLKGMYDEKFPPGTKFGTPLPPPPPVVAPPAPPSGLFQRFVRALSGRAKREEQAALAENERRAAEHRQAVAAALAADRPIDEMIGRLAETIPVEPGDLESLAAARAQRVRDHFIQQGQLAADRFFLSKTAGNAQAARGPRVFLALQ